MLAAIFPVLVFVAPLAAIKAPPNDSPPARHNESGLIGQGPSARTSPKGPGEGWMIPVSLRITVPLEAPGPASTTAKALVFAPAFPRSGFQVNVEMAF